MTRPLKRILHKTLKITGIVLGGSLLLLFVLPYLFPQVVNRKIDEWANKNINGNINFTGTSLSFFKKFPALTLTMHNVTLKGSAPFEKDTLIAAKEISLGIDLSSVFKHKITINKISLNQAFINIQVDSLGLANYNIYKQKPENATEVTDTNGGGASLGISSIIIENSRLVYNDRSIPMTVNARGFNYSGSGDLSKDIFDLNTHTDIQSFDFLYNKQPYVISKKIHADLVTEINTRSLSFIFRKNDLMINQLPVEFNGRFGFIKDGYDMAFNLNSHEKDINEIVSALPAEYLQLLDNTKIDGLGEIQVALTGKYIAKDSVMPTLSMNLKVRNGYIANKKSPSPVRDLYIDMSAKFPGFKPDSLSVNIDSIYFNIADGYLSSVFRIKGVNEPEIYAKVHSEIDLEKWDKTFGLSRFHLKGRYSLHLLAEGRYAKSIVRSGLRKKADTIITSIPKFTLTSTFRKGYFKYAALPEAISDISFDLQADCPDNNYKHINIAIDSINIAALNNYIKGYFRLGNANDFPIDAMLQANFHLEDLKLFYPIDGLDLKGDLVADIKAKGDYQPDKKNYPVMSANITLQNGSVKTKYYPHPIENIQINTNITDNTGSLKGLNVSIKPLTFTFENEPFSVKAELHDFTDLDYKVHLNGKLDVGKIYQVFSRKGYNVTGIVTANLFMKGKQSDAVAGRYDNLFNKGKLSVKDLVCYTELYPKPFIISRGDFSFKQDKMQFDTLSVSYGNSDVVLNGAVSNIIDYIIKPGSVLTGVFNMESDLICINDFMAFADTSKQVNAPAPASTAGTPTGVILVPKNLNLDFTADIDKVTYNDIVLTDTKGHLVLKNDSLLLKDAGFNLIGAPVSMDAAYTSISPNKAFFDYHISAEDFDVQKAYNNIKIFHDLASSAANAEGLISLDYQLSGYLDGNMMPVYPSLAGGGVLSAKKIKMHGFKLFNEIRKEAKQDSLDNDPDVAKVAIKSSIANNIITIEPTKMKIAIFRARFEGQVSFSKALDLKFRLGLPPMGLIGIPMTITGTQDNPKVEMRKGKKEDELAEVADKDD